ncbi:MAG: hypothetical protein ACO1PB_09950 [Ramlibacter sp.]
MASSRKWGADDGAPLLLPEPAPGAEAARMEAVVGQCRSDVQRAREQLARAKALLAHARRIRHPMLPQGECGSGPPGED